MVSVKQSSWSHNLYVNLWPFYRTVCALLKRDMSIINDEDDASNTPLHVAALNGNDKVAKELLDRGAAIDARWEEDHDFITEVNFVLLRTKNPLSPNNSTKSTLKIKIISNGKEYCVFLSPEPKVEVVKFSESFYPSRTIRNYRTKQSNC